jgi:pyruvate,water dikinase
MKAISYSKQMTVSEPIQVGTSLGPQRRVSGPLKIISSSDHTTQVAEGNIVYVPSSVSTTNNVTLFYDLAKSDVRAILCERIERTDHGVLLANELGIPCISGISNTLCDYNGERLTIMGNEIYLGDVFNSNSYQKSYNNLPFPDCDTEIKLNLGFPEVLEKHPKLSGVTEGVGFMRLEFLLLDLLDDTHPKEYTERHGREALENQLANRIESVVSTYSDPVWIRTDDFAVSHLRQMECGKKHENKEDNSMLGWRGISRSTEDPGLYDIQIESIKKLVDRGYENIGLFPPMTRLQSEFLEWKSYAKDAGLTDVSFGLMVETPAVALTFEQFIEHIDFVVFGSNDLTQFTLAIDRNNERLQSKFDEKEDAVLKLFERVISISNNNEIETCIGGQAASDEQLARKLIEFGIDALSVNPDFETVSKIRKSATEIETSRLNN